MDQKTTIYDIAKKLDITAATVSRALNNNPKISEATRKLVLETAAKMNYKQNRLAQSLRSGKSNNVGVIVPRIDVNFFASVIRGIEEELHPEGYDGILMSISNMSKENDPIIKHVVDKNVPLIFFDRKKKMDGVSSVTIDDFEGGYLATKNLIDAGCTRIAHFSGDRSLEIYENRFKGYEQALKDFGLEWNPDYVIQTKSNVDAGRSAVTKLLSLPNPPNAIFSSSDFAALGAIQELKENGIKIPEDFCVFGFGNEPFTRFLELSISSVDQSPLEMGRMAAKVFLEQINNTDNIKIEKKVVLKPELQIRKSSTR
jgi:LacI family transcriptional regulator